ncbi:MAG: hypothetical protein MJ246_06950 [Clostridia bacterium]|nr:hypothetical protein [Clostridia bacterium]
MILENKDYANDYVTLDDDIEIYDGLTKLVLNQDYTLEYSNNFEVSNQGTNDDNAYVTITGMGHYSGSKTNSFNIIPKKILVSDLALPDDETGLKITKVKNDSKKSSLDETHFTSDELKPFVLANNETLTFSYEDAFIATPSGNPEFYGDKENIKSLKNVVMVGITMDDDSGSYIFCNELGEAYTTEKGNYLFANASYLIDNVQPEITSIEILNTENKLQKGDTLSFKVTFDERMKYSNIDDVYLSYTFGKGDEAYTSNMPLILSEYSGDDDNYSILTFSKVLNDLPDDKMIGEISDFQIVIKNDGFLTDMGSNAAVSNVTCLYDFKDFYFVTLNFGVTLESEYDEDSGIAKFTLTISSERPIESSTDEIKAAIGCKGVDVQTGHEDLINLLTTSGVTINELIEKQKYEIIIDTFQSDFITDVNTKGRELVVFLSKEAIRDDISNFNKPVTEKVKVHRTLKDNNIKITKSGEEIFLNPKDNLLYLDSKYSNPVYLKYDDEVKFETLDLVDDAKLKIAHLIDGTRTRVNSDSYVVTINNSSKQIDEIYEWKEDYARAGFIKVIFDVYSLDRLANIKTDIYDKIKNDSTISYDDKTKMIEDEIKKLFTNPTSKDILVQTGDLTPDANIYVTGQYDDLITKELIRLMDSNTPITVLNLTTIINDISSNVADYYDYIRSLDNLLDKKNKKEDISAGDVNNLLIQYYNLDPLYRDYLDNTKDHKKKIDDVKQIYYDKKVDNPVTGTDNLIYDIIVPGIPTEEDKNPKNIVEERFELIGNSNLVKSQSDSITLSGEFISDAGVINDEKDYLSSQGFDFTGKDILYSNDLILKNQDMQDVSIKSGAKVVLLLDLDKDLANIVSDIYMINYADSSKTSVSS